MDLALDDMLMLLLYLYFVLSAEGEGRGAEGEVAGRFARQLQNYGGLVDGAPPAGAAPPAAGAPAPGAVLVALGAEAAPFPAPFGG